MDEEKQNDVAEVSSGEGLLSLLSNPDAMNKMAGALSRLGILEGDSDTSAPAEQSAKKSADEESAQAVSDTGNPLSSLLSNPEILSKIPTILSALSASSGKGSASPSSRERGCKDRRITLLLALRPYLSPHRRDIVDYLVKMNKLGELFKSLK